MISRRVGVGGLLGIGAFAQPRQMPPATLLKEPAGWRYERMPVPPGFAPDVALRGFEEARFAPGMFDNTSPTYFTYVLALLLDAEPELNARVLQDFLEKYYRGLSVAVGRQKAQTPDPAQMKAAVRPEGPDGQRFTANVSFFDSFTDGRRIELNLEIRLTPRLTSGKTGCVLLISPRNREEEVWTRLREIGSKAVFDGS